LHFVTFAWIDDLQRTKQAM